MTSEYVNKIIKGNSFEVVKDLDDNSIDLILFSPPYWLQRNYNTDPIILGGNTGCDHSFVEYKGIKVSPDTSYKERKFTQIYKLCNKCNAFEGEFGQEPSVEMYLEHFLILLKELYRILKPTGGLWIEIGEKYYPSPYKKHSSQANVPEKLKIMITDKLEMFVRNTIILHRYTVRPESLKTRFSKKYSYLYYFTKSPTGKHYFNLDAVKIPSKIGAPKNPGDVWQVLANKIKGSNSASYSNDIVDRVIKAGCPKNGIVLDPFSGIGHTCYVAKILGRKFIGIELANNSYLKSSSLIEEVLI